MIRFWMTNTQDYLQEIINFLDFEGLNNFLNDHMRKELNFEELVLEISRNGIEAFNKDNLLQMFFDTFFYEVSIVRPIFVKILLFSILFSLAHRMLLTKSTYVSSIGFFIIYSTLMVLLMQSFFLVREIAIDGMGQMLNFLNALIPTYSMALIFTGSSVTGAFSYEIGFFLIYFVEFMMKNFLSPLIHVFILVLFLNHLFDEDKLSKLADFIEKIVTIILKLAFGAVIGLGVVQSILSPVKDRLANHVILSGMSSIPGVGGALGSVGEIILSCGMLIKNSVGIVGLILLALISVMPILKICYFWLMYHILAIVLQPLSDKRITQCVMGVARGCDLYLKIMVYSLLLFFVLFSMVTVATSFVF
ncbi:MAG: stage III sporulation protein AE [Agathobacter sp.]|nr:stage III sporulation protein AE [Agathobacter sp.]